MPRKATTTTNNTRTSTYKARRPSVVAQAKAEVAARKAPRTWTDTDLVLAISLTINVVALYNWVF